MAEKFEHCHCGHDSTHAWVVDRACYSLLGWFLIAFGISSLPKAVERRCDRCGYVFSRTEDEAIRSSKRYR